MLNAHYLSRQAGRVGPRILFLLAWILVAPGHAFADPPKKRESKPGTAVSRPAPVFPLKKDKDGRYLVDQKGTPFLIAGESGPLASFLATPPASTRGLLATLPPRPPA